MFLLPLSLASQDFTQKEIKRFDKILKRSSSRIKDFNKDAYISIERLGNSEIEGLVENALFMSGFEVVSNKVAKDAVNISNTSDEEIEISRKVSYKSVYVVTVSGQYYLGAILGKCQRGLLTFTARIVDLANNGKLVGTFRFSGNALTFIACEEDVINAFVYKISKLSE